jgi:hypothetical protein
MSILSGLGGNVLVEDLHYGPVAPFDAAMVIMLVGGAIILSTWPESYGDVHHVNMRVQFKEAFKCILGGEALPQFFFNVPNFLEYGCALPNPKP